MAVRRLKQGGYKDLWETDLFEGLRPEITQEIWTDRSTWMPRQSYQGQRESWTQGQKAASGYWQKEESGPATARSDYSDNSWSVISSEKASWPHSQGDSDRRARSYDSSQATYGPRQGSPSSWDGRPTPTNPSCSPLQMATRSTYFTRQRAGGNTTCARR